MDINLELYKMFYVVAKNGNMTKASEELHISQPAISQSIKKLEEQLGGTLFLRSKKGMELTDEGKMFFGYVSSALQMFENAENEFTEYQNLSKGEIRVGASTTLTKIFLMNTIKEFHKKYPNIRIVVVNELSSNLINELKLGKLDFVVFNESIKTGFDLDVDNVGELKQGFVYNPEFFYDDVNSFKELNKYDLILQKKSSNSRQFLDDFMLKNGIVLVPKMEAVSQDLIMEFANSGLGIGFAILEQINKKFPNLRELKINNLIPKMQVKLATSKNLQPTFASKTFIKMLKQNKY